MPLMNLLQNIESDDKNPAKHKKLPQSDEESNDDVSFMLFSYYNFRLWKTYIYLENSFSGNCYYNLYLVNDFTLYFEIYQNPVSRSKTRFPSYSTHVR